MATQPNEIRDLIAQGWTPPAEALEPFRHLLEPFNKARGWITTDKLDEHDVKNLGALLAVFEAFGIEIPQPHPKPMIVKPGTLVLP